MYQYFYLGGSLYSGTVSDFSGSDALIIKDEIRTEQYNLKHLNGKDSTRPVQNNTILKQLNL